MNKIRASACLHGLNHRKVIKAASSRLIHRMLAANIELLILVIRTKRFSSQLISNVSYEFLRP